MVWLGFGYFGCIPLCLLASFQLLARPTHPDYPIAGGVYDKYYEGTWASANALVRSKQVGQERKSMAASHSPPPPSRAKPFPDLHSVSAPKSGLVSVRINMYPSIFSRTVPLCSFHIPPRPCKEQVWTGTSGPLFIQQPWTTPKCEVHSFQCLSCCLSTLSSPPPNPLLQVPYLSTPSSRESKKRSSRLVYTSPSTSFMYL